MENKLNIAKRTDPIDSMDYHTWLKTFNVSSGYVQPTRAQLVAQRGLNSNYHYNAIQSWSVAANGEISNVHA